MQGCNYVDLDFHIDQDVFNVAKLHCEYPAEWQSDYFYSAHTLKKTVDDLQKAGLHRKRVILAKCQEGRILGLHWLQYHPDNEARTGEILSLWVHPDYRGKGIAKKMKKIGEQWLREMGAQKIRTKVHIENGRMLTINKKLGYAVAVIGMEKHLL